MRIWESCGHKELEALVIGNALVSEAEGSTLVHLLEKDWLKSRIELLSDVLNQDPFTKLDSEFKVPKEVSIAHLEDIKASLCFVPAKELDELVGLVLGINHERPSSRAEHDDPVLN